MSHAQLKWPDFTANHTLIIDVDKHEFGIKAEPIEYSGSAFIPKREAHITVLGTELGSRLQQLFIINPPIERQVRQAFESTDWSYTKTGDLRHIARENTELAGMNITEESIIMLVEMEGMTAFYAQLKSLGVIDNDHPVPPPHVTLYTRNCDPGIGIHSDVELSKLSREQIAVIDLDSPKSF
jgi:hypothetical protein